MKRILATLMIITSSALAFTAHAAATAPVDLINTTFEQVKTDVEKAGVESIEADPQVAINIIKDRLLPLIDEKNFTRKVMGRYFAQANRNQKYGFLNTMRDSFINTYASSLVNIGDVKYDIQELLNDNENAKVRLIVDTKQADQVPVDFSFTYKSKDEAWKVANLEIAGINLGMALRDKFERMMQQYNNNIDDVIANWSSQVKPEAIDAE